MQIFNTDDIAIYFHIPFCTSKCPYCDFNSFTNFNDFNEDEFVEMYLKKIDSWKKIIGNKRIKSIFFGGGTPSILKVSSLEKILLAVDKNWKIPAESEISIEINPSSIDDGKMEGYKKIGINRISIGVQSLDENELKFLGRTHSADEAKNCIELAKKYFTNVSVDFIYSLKGQTIEKWKDSLMKIQELDLPHYSIYQLTIEENTPFGRQKMSIPQDEESLKFFNITREFMASIGTPAYEVSNFSKPGFESVHNMNYWDGGDYLGIGAGAHGRVNIGEEFWATEEVKNPKKWLLASEKPAESCKIEYLSFTDRIEEILITSLRTRFGFDYKKYEDFISFDDEWVDQFISNRLLIKDEDNMILTEKGIPLMDYILSKIL